MTRRRLAMIGTGFVLAAAVSASLPATPVGAATPQCTKRVTTSSGVWAPAASNGSHSCWMDQGSASSGVWALQRALVHCYGQKIPVDSDFGPMTANALARVQKQIGAVADGEYGPETAGKMKFSSTKSTSAKACRGGIVKNIGG